MMRQLHYYFLITQLLIITKQSSSSTYKAITVLDKYGSSSEIKKARLASELYGATTVAAIATSSTTTRDEAVIVVSRERKTPGVIQTDGGGKVQMLASDEGQRLLYAAMIGSGLKSDLTFVSKLLRRHASMYWERYDSIPNCNRIALSASQVVQSFNGYDFESEVNDGLNIKTAFEYEYGQEYFSFGRPLAINLLIVDVGENGAGMKAVNPSGVVSEQLVACALGKESEKANNLLQQRWQPNLSVAEVEKICVGIIRDIALDENSKENKESDENEEILTCEILSSDGLITKKL